MTDLWPQDLATTTTSSPLTILREQAALLGAKTKNIVKASIGRYHSNPLPTSRFVTNAKRSEVTEDPFQYAFYLHGPALDNYTYRLFTVAFNVNLYPATFETDDEISQELLKGGNWDIVASDEEMFKSILSRILGSQKTRKVITAILSQSTELGHGNGDSSD